MCSYWIIVSLSITMVSFSLSLSTIVRNQYKKGNVMTYYVVDGIVFTSAKEASEYKNSK